MCRIASLFLLQRLKGSMSGDSAISVIKFLFPARQGAEGHSRHSERNIRGTCTIVCHSQKLGGPVVTAVINTTVRDSGSYVIELMS
jgi:hypothetical protein